MNDAGLLVFPVTLAALVFSDLNSFQLSVLFHQFFQPESWKLYSNLGVFSLSFTLVDSALTIFGMLDPLAGPECPAASCLLYGDLRPRKFLSTRSKEFRNIFNRIIFWTRITTALLWLSCICISRSGALVLIFVAEMLLCI